MKEILLSPAGRLVQFNYGTAYDLLRGVLTTESEVELRKKCTPVTLTTIKAAINGELEGNLSKLGAMRNTFTTGADPEIFVEKDGKIVPAWEVIPTEKTAGGGSWSYTGAKVYPDGFALEIGATAGGCFSYVCDSVQSGLVVAYKAAKELGAKLVAQDCMQVDPAMLQTAPKKFTQLGCAPSFNAYGEVMEMPDGAALPFRTIGSHFHYGNSELVGYDKDQMDALVRMVEALRIPIFTAAFGHLEDPKRRTLYGRVGEYRKPKWGLEMRSTGGVVMRHPMLYHLVSTVTRYCINLAMVYGHGSISLPLRTSVQKIGNESDYKRAKKVLLKNPVYGAIMRSAFTLVRDTEGFGKNIINILTSDNGLSNELDIDSADCVSKNWCLTGGWTGHSEGKEANVSNWANNRTTAWDKIGTKVKKAGA